VLSEFANRRAPADTTGGAYELPPVMEPWDLINPDELEPGESVTSASVYNGEGDKVHRWSVPNLLLQVHHALGWKEPSIIPNSSYPSLAFQEELGGFVNNQNIGFTAVDFAALLAWEETVSGCLLDGHLTMWDYGQSTEEWEDDYIGLVTSQAAGLTMAEAMLAVKDRLISYGDWWPVSGSGGLAGDAVVSEQTLAAKLAEELGGYKLEDKASENPEVVRAYCGMLLRSPQFMLSGLTAWPEDELPESLDGLPCNDELCGFFDYCEAYGELAEGHGYDRIECEKKGSDSLSYGRD